MASTALRLVEEASTKRCQKCGNEGTFGKDKKKPDGLAARCDTCRREDRKVRQERHNEYLRTWTKTNARAQRNTQVRYRHGIEFEEVWLSQRGLCALCDEPMSPLGNQSLSAVVDHDHACCQKMPTCGKCFRGLIHASCNKLLGAASDDQHKLEKAIAYLAKGRVSL
jgi:hypothetical protein